MPKNKYTKRAKVHGNSKFTQVKWEHMMELIKMDVQIQVACDYAKISQETFYQRMREDSNLSEEYAMAKQFVDVASSQNIAKSIIKDKDVEISKRYKQRRDRRYKDKQEVDQTNKNINIDLKDLEGKSPKELEEMRKQLLG
jgi:hypothetical protein